MTGAPGYGSPGVTTHVPPANRGYAPVFSLVGFDVLLKDVKECLRGLGRHHDALRDLA